LWAGAIWRHHQCPLIYSSLELYTSDHEFAKHLWMRRVKTIENKYHKSCWATIVQDPNRGKVLFEDNQNSIVREISKIDINRKVRVSLNLVALSDESSIMRSARVSLVFYGCDNHNDRLTGFSSEKLALSLQCGIPVIAFAYPSFDHIREERCGVLVHALSGGPNAISQILNDYDNYRGSNVCNI
jgi:hypothetical protein